MNRDLIKLDSNENQLEHFFDVDECIRRVNPKNYPEVTNGEVREKIARFFGITKEEIFVSHGSDYLIKALTFGLVRGNSEVIMPEVAFPTYEIAAKIKECNYVKVPLKNYGIDLDETLKAVNENTRLIWISNPHNPTGTFLEEREIIEFLRKVPSYVKVVLDEAYIEYVHENPLSTIEIYKEFSNVIILRTFSKAYGLAGARVGYGIARPEIIEEFKFVIGPFDLNSYAQVLAAKAIDEKEYVSKVRDINTKALKLYEEALEDLGLQYIKSYASFIMINMGNRSSELTEKLRKENIIIKDGKYIGMDGFVRISTGNMEQNNIIIEKIKEFLK